MRTQESSLATLTNPAAPKKGLSLIVHRDRRFAEESLALPLQCGGFTTEVVSDLDEALRIIEERRDQVRVVVTLNHVGAPCPLEDHNYKAEPLVRAASEGTPRIPVVVVTEGDSGDVDLDITDSQRGIYGLSMPFDSLIVCGEESVRGSLQNVLEDCGFKFERTDIAKSE